ncbi:MAG TPA: hypothetical protein VMT79_07650 [Candidatus Binatia bacterium]|nr:hypothetical protein [Candidatus Binatia bacterium]
MRSLDGARGGIVAGFLVGHLALVMRLGGAEREMALAFATGPGVRQ